MATALELVQQATAEMGLAVPATAVGNTNTDVVQILALLNAVGYELQREHQWQALTQQYITTVQYTTVTGSTTLNSTTMTVSSTAGFDDTYGISGAGINQACYVSAVVDGTTLTLSQPATSTNTSQTYTLSKVKYSMPAGYDRQIDRTHWDKSKHWEMLGPESAQQWEWLISGYISTGPRVRYRIFGGYFQIWPFLSTSEVIGFEYLSKYWALSASGTPQASFTADTDTCIFPDRLMVLGLKRKYFQIKGFNPVFDEDYYREKNLAKSNDAGSATLSFAPRASTVLIGFENIPDSNYGS